MFGYKDTVHYPAPPQVFERIQSTILPPWMFPFWLKCSWTNLPKRLELLL